MIFQFEFKSNFFIESRFFIESYFLIEKPLLHHLPHKPVSVGGGTGGNSLFGTFLTANGFILIILFIYLFIYLFIHVLFIGITHFFFKFVLTILQSRFYFLRKSH